MSQPLLMLIVARKKDYLSTAKLLYSETAFDFIVGVCVCVDSIVQPSHQANMSDAVRPSSTKYFYGRITRDEAEDILRHNGAYEGLYLLRESMTVAGNYALSICHQGRIHHYSIERQPDGTVMIQDGKKFKGPVELVNHHKKTLDGFLTKPTVECERPTGTTPMAWPGVTIHELELILQEQAQRRGLKGVQLENVLGPQRAFFVSQVAKELHKEQPWFWNRIDRDEADLVMQQSGHEPGKFLVRERDDKSYALSLSYQNQTKHYKIEKHHTVNGEKLAIEDGPRFDSLMDMIAHYHNKTDGLLCKLTTVCVRRGWERKRTRGPAGMDKSAAYGLLPDVELNAQRILRGAAAMRTPGSRPLPPSPASKLPDPQGIASVPSILKEIWDERDDRDMDAQGPRRSIAGMVIDDDPQKIYDSVPRTEDVFNLNRNDLDLHEKLGAGNFGSVIRGVYRRGGQDIPVAVKTLKQDELPNAESDLMKEARLMANLQHRNIVRMIGVCRSESIMLVLELAQQGPLNKYLKKHTDMPIKNVLDLTFQVAEGMAYLEEKNFVHRDLAARNVLLVNERFAKISDFGMSKALGLGNEYYRANAAGKWPLKWYAPECIYYFRFDSKSDIWSYGVTLWEATSYGAKPYRGQKGQEILDLIEKGRRLEKPEKCPLGVYENIMLKCWQYEKAERPPFRKIVDLLRKYR